MLRPVTAGRSIPDRAALKLSLLPFNTKPKTNMLQLIITIALALGLFCLFWYAMIEAQTDIPNVNEPSKRGKKEKQS
tara:strand:- start:579 stop:809 length:231 start_codon:yes stop_codon:yes gene_type:complete